MRHQLAITLLGATFSLVSVVACSALDFGTGPGGTGFGGSFQSSPGSGGLGNSPTGAGGSLQDKFSYVDSCGASAECLPGSNETCELPEGATGGGSSAGAGGYGGNGGGGTGGDGGATTGAGGATTGTGGGTSAGAGGGGSAPSADCKLGVDVDGDAGGICVALGERLGSGQSCLQSEDCDVGLGCVQTDATNKQCRPYCCGDVELCAPNTYCALAPVAALDLPAGLNPADAPKVPVCIEADRCTLDMPCPDPDKTCTVVRLAGPVTSCVKPGEGTNGQSCPCAAGHFCDTDANQCLKLCKLNEEGACPPSFSCQGGSVSVPLTHGTCVETAG